MENQTIKKMKVGIERSVDFQKFISYMETDIHSDDADTIKNCSDYLWVMINSDLNLQINNYLSNERDRIKKELIEINKQRELLKQQQRLLQQEQKVYKTVNNTNTKPTVKAVELDLDI